MIKRICYKCKTSKELNEFRKDKKRKLGICYLCKSCERNYRNRNKKTISERNKKYRKENLVGIKIKGKLYYEKNKERINKQNREYYEKNIAKVAKQSKKYRNENSNTIKKRQKKWYLLNKTRILAIRKTYIRNRRNIDPLFKLSQNISHGINRSLKDNKNGRHWENLVGYTQEDLRKHLEANFKEGMNWNNYGRGGWNVDHRIPIYLFNITSAKCKGFKKCWGLENLQPLWEKDNFKKHNILFY